jgi:hypothetical protein
VTYVTDDRDGRFRATVDILDANAEALKTIKAGRMPFIENGAEDLLKHLLPGERARARGGFGAHDEGASAGLSDRRGPEQLENRTAGTSKFEAPCALALVWAGHAVPLLRTTGSVLASLGAPRLLQRYRRGGRG